MSKSTEITRRCHFLNFGEIFQTKTRPNNIWHLVTKNLPSIKDYTPLVHNLLLKKYKMKTESFKVACTSKTTILDLFSFKLLLVKATKKWPPNYLLGIYFLDKCQITYSVQTIHAYKLHWHFEQQPLFRVYQEVMNRNRLLQLSSQIITDVNQ